MHRWRRLDPRDPGHTSGARRGRRARRLTACASRVLAAAMAAALTGGGTGAGASPRRGAAGLDSRQVPGVSCSNKTALDPRLAAAPAMVGVHGRPFGVAVTTRGRFAFAGLSNSVGVFSVTGGRLRLRAAIAVPHEALGVGLSPNGRYLVVADGGGGAEVLDVTSAEHGSSGALLGALSSSGHGAIEASVSSNGRFAFVSLESSNELAVFNLQRAVASDFADHTPIGVVPLDAPVGMALSPGGRYLYVTSEVAYPSGQGSVSTLDVARAVTNASRAVLTAVPAGCRPARVVATGASVYVTARASDALLWFSSHALVHHPSGALETSVRVGPAPVSLAVVQGGKAILVADSDRFGTAAHANLALVRLGAGGRPQLEGYVRSGSFPRPTWRQADTAGWR